MESGSIEGAVGGGDEASIRIGAVAPAEVVELQEAGAIRDKDGRLFWLLPREKGDVIMPADGGPLSDDREAMGVLLHGSLVASGEGVAENARA